MYASSYNCPFGPWQVCCVDDSSLCRGENALEPLLMKYKVDLAMWGHVHFAELSCPMVDGKCVSKQDAEGYDAPIHAVIGNGGPQEPSATTKADWSRYLDHDNGFTVLTSHNSSLLSIEFYGDEPDLDKPPPMKFRHDIVRHRGGQPHPRPSPPPSPPPHPPPSPSPAPPAPPPPSQPSLVNLFPVHSNNVSCYFAPLLLRVPRTDVLIALAEARMFSCSDGGAKRIAMRRSKDNGQSWAATQWIWNDTSLSTLPTDTERWAQWLAMGGENFTGSNFGTIFYDDRSDVLSLYVTYGTSVESAVDMLIITSADHGASWDTNPPRNVTDIIRNGPPQADGSTIKDFCVCCPSCFVSSAITVKDYVCATTLQLFRVLSHAALILLQMGWLVESNFSTANTKADLSCRGTRSQPIVSSSTTQQEQGSCSAMTPRVRAGKSACS